MRPFHSACSTRQAAAGVHRHKQQLGASRAARGSSRRAEAGAEESQARPPGQTSLAGLLVVGPGGVGPSLDPPS